MGKVNKWAFFGATRDPTMTDHKHLLSNAISRTDFVSNMGKLHNQRQFPVVFNPGNAFIIEICTVEILSQI